MQRLLKFLIFGFLFSTVAHFSYLHGVHVGMVETEKNIGPALYLCVDIFGGVLKHE